MNQVTVLEPLAARTDPRQSMEGGALVLASRNAYPVVAGRKAAKDGMGLLAGAAGAVLLGAVTLITLSNGRTARETAAAPPVQAAAQPAPAAEVMVPPTPPAPAMSAPASAFYAPSPSAPLVITPAPSAAPVLQTGVDRDRSPTLVLDNGLPPSAAAAVAGTGAAVAAAQPARAMPQGLTEAEAFGFRVGETAAGTADARAMVDPSLTVSQGTLIPAVLETAIDSDLPGYVRAVVSQDVRSFDGTRVLIPRSSRLIGEYKSGLSAGQTRAYVVWSRLIRPDGVSVALASPAVDAQGRTGLEGQVDNHFLKRFGSSLLLSVIGAAGAVRSGGVTIATGDSAASVAAQRDGARPPTIRVRQGQPIRVFTARDLNFALADGPARS
jgi:type IV secretion system protein VirB10